MAAASSGAGDWQQQVEGVVSRLVAWGDLLVPKADAVVVRPGQDHDDQARQVVAALDRLGVARVTLLVSGDGELGPVGAASCRILPARSLRGILAYWRARVVVHTHGVFGSRRASRRKTFVNVWHGMPVKRLEAGSDVGRFQTDVTIATSPVHAGHLAETWGLCQDQVALTGLPRNDLLRSGGDRPASLRRLAGDGPLAVWLPTFRAPAAGGRVDGRDRGEATQFDGATPEAVEEAFARLGAHVIIKPHPLAPRPERIAYDHVTVWAEDDLAAAGLTLYELLAHADLLVTDHSSVWIDFLLRDRPVLFAISDLEQYRQTRGFYFSSIEDLLPGPLVTDLAGLEDALGTLLGGDDPWVGDRRAALDLHHTHQDAGSADRVARLVVGQLPDRPPRS